MVFCSFSFTFSVFFLPLEGLGFGEDGEASAPATDDGGSGAGPMGLTAAV